MIIGRIANATRDLGKPEDWNDQEHGQCGVLPIADQVINGIPFMFSAWQLTPEELNAVGLGASIILGICGTQHPVVSLSVSEPPVDPSPILHFGVAIGTIEQRVRKTICPTFTTDDKGQPVETIEGRISKKDFDTLVALARLGERIGQ